jgi:ATP-dependent DNA ligase
MAFRGLALTIRTRSKPPGFILPCQPALADRAPAGPGWLHEIKFDGYRLIARKDGERIRLWARTTSDYSKAFTRIRDAVAALPVDSSVLDGEAVLMRSDNTSECHEQRHRAVHSITSSANNRNSRGIASPSSFAVFRLKTSSSFVGCSTGRSAGLAPFRILFSRVAARRNRSGKLAP